MKKSKDAAITCLQLLTNTGATFKNKETAVTIIKETLENWNRPNPKIPRIDFNGLLLFLNESTGRGFRVVAPAIRKKYLARLKEGYDKKIIVNAIKNACNSEYHKETGFQYLTPEYFSRATTLDKYGFDNIASKKTKKPQEQFNKKIPIE